MIIDCSNDESVDNDCDITKSENFPIINGSYAVTVSIGSGNPPKCLLCKLPPSKPITVIITSTSFHERIIYALYGM